MNIYAGNLPYSVTEDDLREAFAAFGEVANVQLITDKFSGQSKGFGFVEMPASEQKPPLRQKNRGRTEILYDLAYAPYGVGPDKSIVRFILVNGGPCRWSHPS